MKKTLLILLVFVAQLGFAQGSPTGTMSSGKYKMNTPVAGAMADSVVVWNGTDKLMKVMPRSSFAGGGGSVGTLDEVLEAGSSAFNKEIVITADSDPDNILLTAVGGEGFASLSSYHLGDDRGNSYVNPSGFLATDAFSSESIRMQKKRFIKYYNIGGITADLKLEFEVPTISTTRTWTFPFETGIAASREWVTANFSGGGGITEVTGTDGVTVANGTTAPVIGLGNITPDSVTASGAVTGTNLSGTNTGDNATNTTSNTYADGKVQNSLTASTAIAPSATAVNAALSKVERHLYATTTPTPAITGSINGRAAASILIPSGSMPIGFKGEINFGVVVTTSVVANTFVAFGITPTALAFGADTSAITSVGGFYTAAGTEKSFVFRRSFEILADGMHIFKIEGTSGRDNDFMATLDPVVFAFNPAIDNYFNPILHNSSSSKSSYVKFITIKGINTL